jgi:endonuclease VIII
MPEGDTIFRAAATLNRALAGTFVTRFESVLPALLRAAEHRALLGRTIEEVTSRGKHLVMRFSGSLALRTHMRMSGSWHLYRPGERWIRPRLAMRILLATETFEAVAFDVHDAELALTPGPEAPPPAGGARRASTRASTPARPRGALGRLGPDLLAEEFDEDEALERLRGCGDEEIGTALLNQQVVAGIGNVYKSEVLFLARLDPFARVRTLPDGNLRQLLRTARRLLRINAKAGATAAITTYAGLRRTTGRSNPGERMWVYRRAGRPCRRCGTPLRMRRQGTHARSTYWCAVCQVGATTAG